MTPLIVAIWVAGAVQLAIAAANLEVARKLDYRANLARLTPIVAQVFLAHAVYIVLVMIWFSSICLVFARELASGDPLARFLTGGLAAFWGLLLGSLRVKYQRVEYCRESDDGLHVSAGRQFVFERE